jgi:hypothetical protein
MACSLRRRSGAADPASHGGGQHAARGVRCLSSNEGERKQQQRRPQHLQAATQRRQQQGVAATVQPRDPERASQCPGAGQNWQQWRQVGFDKISQQHALSASIAQLLNASSEVTHLLPRFMQIPLLKLNCTPGRSLPSPDGSNELSSGDFAALLASGTAGIRAIPAASSVVVPPSPARQPLDADAFTNGGDPMHEQRLNSAAAAVRRVASGGVGSGVMQGPGVSGSPQHSSEGAPAGRAQQDATARGRSAMQRTKQQMALFEEFGNLRPPSRSTQ